MAKAKKIVVSDPADIARANAFAQRAALYRALRFTDGDGGPDVIPERDKVQRGWLPTGGAFNLRVEPAATKADAHLVSPLAHADVITVSFQQHGRSLYSTKLAALMAARRETEMEAAEALLRLDRHIERERQAIARGEGNRYTEDWLSTSELEQIKVPLPLHDYPPL